jgi:hypothetical protein
MQCNKLASNVHDKHAHVHVIFLHGSSEHDNMPPSNRLDTCAAVSQKTWHGLPRQLR